MWLPFFWSLRRQVGFEQPVEVDDHIAHLCVINRFLCLASPRIFGAGIIGKDTNEVDLLQINERKCAGIADATAHHEVEFLHGLAFIRGRKVPGPVAKLRVARKRPCANIRSGFEFCGQFAQLARGERARVARHVGRRPRKFVPALARDVG